MTNKKGQMFMQLAVACIGMGVVLMVGYIIINQVQNALEEQEMNITDDINVTGNITASNYIARINDVTNVEYKVPSIDYSKYGNTINDNFDDLYFTDMDLNLESI